jgi:hypothetical protein
VISESRAPSRFSAAASGHGMRQSRYMRQAPGQD